MRALGLPRAPIGGRAANRAGPNRPPTRKAVRAGRGCPAKRAEKGVDSSSSQSGHCFETLVTPHSGGVFQTFAEEAVDNTLIWGVLPYLRQM